MTVNIISKIKAMLTDPVSGKQATVTEDGRLNVALPPAAAPTGKTPVARFARGSVNGSQSSLDTFVIPNEAVLTVQFFEGGAAGTNMSRIALYYAPAGTLNGTEQLLANGYVNNSNYSRQVELKFVGNGTRAIIMQRTRLDATAREMSASWQGYY